MATNQEKFDRIYFELTEKFATRSKYRDRENPYRDTLVGYVLQLDAYQHHQDVEDAAREGNKDAIALVKREADRGDKDSAAVYAELQKLGVV